MVGIRSVVIPSSSHLIVGPFRSRSSRSSSSSSPAAFAWLGEVNLDVLALDLSPCSSRVKYDLLFALLCLFEGAKSHKGKGTGLIPLDVEVNDLSEGLEHCSQVVVGCLSWKGGTPMARGHMKSLGYFSGSGSSLGGE